MAATLLPLLSVVLLLLAGFLRNALRSARNSGGLGQILFHLLGGEVTGRVPAYIATGAIGLAFVCSLIGFVVFLADDHQAGHKKDHAAAAVKPEGDRLNVRGSVAEDDPKTQTQEDDGKKNDKRLHANVKWREVVPKLNRKDGSVAAGSLVVLNSSLGATTLPTACFGGVWGDPVLFPIQMGLGFSSFSYAQEPVVHYYEIGDGQPDKESAEKKDEKHDKGKADEAKKPGHGNHDKGQGEESKKTEHGYRWAGSFSWASVSPKTIHGDKDRATTLKVGYYIDSLSAIMFVMVTLVSLVIHLFSMGYMADELEKTVEDHEVHTEQGHLQRRGRFGRFFLYLSLFCFSMLNLVLADNLFQVFVSWELVGICSYLLIGFYYERTSAANAANKAFITNRVGDVGFIIGLLIVWSYIGTLNFQEIFERIRCPARSNRELAGQIVRADKSMLAYGQTPEVGRLFVPKKSGESGEYALLFPRHAGHAVLEGPDKAVAPKVYPSADEFGYIPYWMLVAAGLGIFLGCVGKSAQFPLQVWLPDAMEGPTPVSALIHAATMVAAGVYLVGRCFPLFTIEVLLTIAYTGCITLFLAATIAVVMTDIKKVLAYSTVSQLGYMMLALGVGGWAAGLFHLITHACFKALLFLGAGSVIYGCHHEQDMRKMGGLYPKMKITALTMLMGVLAISGIPLFSGWYSKDAVLASAYGFGMVYNEHFLLFLLPLITAGLTTFYMFRMWFMTFTGTPRDEQVFEHAHESPWLITLPLILLAFLSVTVAWGWPIWDAEKSWLEEQIHYSQPDSVTGDFGGVDANANGPAFFAHANHSLAGGLALLTVIIGLTFAYLIYYRRAMNPADAVEQFPGVYRFLQNKWYFDEVYSVVVVRPGLVVAGWARWFDAQVIDRAIHSFAWLGVATSFLSGLNDRRIVDGLANLTAGVCQGIGNRLRGFQTGYIRSYVLFLVLAAMGLWVLLHVFLGVPAAGAVK